MWLALACCGLWAVLLRRFDSGDVYAVLGPFACVVCAICFALAPRELLAAFRPRAVPCLAGVAVGVLMTLLTYPVFQLATKLVPALDAQVAGLYEGARSTTTTRALLWLVAIISAEELLFRGLLPHALSPLTGTRTAYLLALALYALCQLGSGSWIVGLLALVCGAIWTILRVRTQSLLASWIAHAIWTPTLIVLWPVT